MAESHSVSVDRLLSGGYFGDTRHVLASCVDRAAAYLDFADDDASIDPLREMLSSSSETGSWQIVLHPIARYAVRRAMWRLVHGGEAETTPAVRLPSETWARSVSENHPRAHASIGEIVWLHPSNAPECAAVMSLLYEAEIAPRGLSARVALIDGTPATVRGCQDGHALLMRLLPETAQSCIQHVRLMCTYSVDGKASASEAPQPAYFDSVSTPTIPGAIFLFSGALEEPWLAAESLLHEATHTKLFDLYMSPGLLVREYDARKSESVVSTWNKNLKWRRNHWPFDQGLGAYHVYIHLIAFFLAARTDTTSDHPRIRAHVTDKLAQAIRRAALLEPQLSAQAATWLTDEGAAFLAWLRDCRAQLTEMASGDCPREREPGIQ